MFSPLMRNCLPKVRPWLSGSPGSNPEWLRSKRPSSLGRTLATRFRQRLGGRAPMTMRELYFVLAALHIVSMVSTGILWTLLDLKLAPSLKPHFRDIRAVHFGSLYLVPWFLGLAFAFDRLKVPEWHQAFFPIGLGALVFFSGLGYVFPRPPGLDPFYYWTKGWAMVLSMIGLAALVFALFWTTTVLVIYAAAR